MSDNTTNLSKEISRRTLFKGACGAVGAVALVGLTGSEVMAAKLTQQAANYRTTPNGGAQCNKCKNWVAPNGCKQVEGTISPTGWCQLFMGA